MKSSKPYMSPSIKKVFDAIKNALSDRSIYSGVDLKRVDETFLKNKMHTSLYRELTNSYQDLVKGSKKETAQKYVDDHFIFPGGRSASIHKIAFLGTDHIPDFEYEFDKKKIAIEIKKGDSGYTIREGLGQSIVFRSYYDYCVCFVVDSTTDKNIKTAFDTNEKDKILIDSFYKNYNILFTVY